MSLIPSAIPRRHALQALRWLCAYTIVGMAFTLDIPSEMPVEDQAPVVLGWLKANETNRPESPRSTETRWKPDPSASGSVIPHVGTIAELSNDGRFGYMYSPATIMDLQQRVVVWNQAQSGFFDGDWFLMFSGGLQLSERRYVPFTYLDLTSRQGSFNGHDRLRLAPGTNPTWKSPYVKLTKDQEGTSLSHGASDSPFVVLAVQVRHPTDKELSKMVAAACDLSQATVLATCASSWVTMKHTDCAEAIAVVGLVEGPLLPPDLVSRIAASGWYPVYKTLDRPFEVVEWKRSGTSVIASKIVPKTNFNHQSSIVRSANGRYTCIQTAREVQVADGSGILTRIPWLESPAVSDRPESDALYVSCQQTYILDVAHLRAQSIPGPPLRWPRRPYVDEVLRGPQKARLADGTGVTMDLIAKHNRDGRRLAWIREETRDKQQPAKSRYLAIIPGGALPATVDPVVLPPCPFELKGRTWGTLTADVFWIEGSERYATSGVLILNRLRKSWTRILPQSAWTDQGHIFAPRRLINGLSITLGDDVVPAGSLDAHINRPDLVLENIGLAEPHYIDLFRRAIAKRTARLGLSGNKAPGKLKITQLTRVSVLNQPPVTTTSQRLTLPVEIRSARYFPSSLGINVGGFTTKVVQIPADTKPVTVMTMDVDIDLHTGINRIEIIPRMPDGTKGIPAMAVVRCTGGPPPSTRVVAIGVSQYRETANNLLFAAADAQAIASTMAGEHPGNASVFTNQAVIREALPSMKKHLQGAAIGDLAIVSVAAHGVIDRDGNYFIATHDTEFSDPSKRGIRVDELMDLLRASPARRKLLLIDCCHAGERDPDLIIPGAPELAKAIPRGLRVAARPAHGEPHPAPFSPASPAAPTLTPVQKDTSPTAAQVAQAMFADVGWDDGITVLAACRGDEASWESPEWGHGAFTRAILASTEDSTADENQDGALSLAEMGYFAMERVASMTDGRQHPEIRAGELDADIIIRSSRAPGQTQGKP